MEPLGANKLARVEQLCSSSPQAQEQPQSRMPIRQHGAWTLLLITLAFSPGAVEAGTVLVKMRRLDVGPNVYYVFDPTNVAINVGDTVTWTNTATDLHDTTDNPSSGPRLWASPLFASTSANNTFSYTFTSPGLYTYVCQTHYFRGHVEETGTVTVIAPNIPPDVAIDSPTNGTPYFAPARFYLEASASDNDGSIAQVEFFRGSSSIGVATGLPYTNLVSKLAAGTYAFTAVATDDQGARATSAVVNVNVIMPPTLSNSVQSLPDGLFHFRIFGGNSGEMCIVDACEVLPLWTPVFTNVFPNTACAFCPFLDYTEVLTNLNRRFYRARIFP